MPDLTRAVLYARVSTTEQATGGHSIGVQIERTRAYATAKGWTVVGEYVDPGASGALSFYQRPSGALLLEDAADGIFETVIFTKLDRFARSTVRALQDFETLEDLGIDVVFVEEDIDTGTPQGRLFRTLLAAFAEFEREQIRDRFMAGRHASAAKGAGWGAGRPPYGYEIDEDGSLAVVEEEAEVIRHIFHRRARGASLRAISADCAILGWRPRPRGDDRPGVFSTGSIATYLKNPAYRGNGIVRHLAPSKGAEATEFVFEAPAIVSPALWNDAQIETPPGKDCP